MNIDPHCCHIFAQLTLTATLRIVYFTDGEPEVTELIGEPEVTELISKALRARAQALIFWFDPSFFFSPQTKLLTTI